MSRAFDLNTSTAGREYLTSPPAAVYNNLNVFTIAAWVYARSFGGNSNGVAICKDPLHTVPPLISIADGFGGYVSTLICEGPHIVGTNTQASSVPVNGSFPGLNRWVHLAITYDHTGDKKCHVFINGTEPAYQLFTASPTGSVGDDSADGWWLGNDTSVGPVSPLFFNEQWDGYIAEVGIWNAVLTAGQIQAAAASAGGALGVLPANLVAYWGLRQSSLLDGSGNGNTLTMSPNNPIVGPDPPFNATYALTLKQIRDDVRAFLLNTDTSQASWTDAELNGYINEGIFYVQQLGQFYEELGVIETYAGKPTYDAPDNQYQFIRMTYDQEFLPQTNEYELDRDTNSGWRNNPTGTPARFYLPQHNQIGLYPTPNTSGAAYSASLETGEALSFTLADGVTLDPDFSFSSEFGIVTALTNTSTQNNGHALIRFVPDPLNRLDGAEFGLVIDYQTDSKNLGYLHLAIPDTLTLDSHVPQLHETVHPALIFYTLMRCFARDGAFQDMALAQAWYQTFLDWMDSALQAKAREFPTRVRSAEPYAIGNILQGRLQAVGPPSQLIVLGSP